MQRSNKLISKPRTKKEYFGDDYNLDIERHFSEKVYPDKYVKDLLDKNDKHWDEVCNASVYGHIRLCGRKAQKNAEDREFLVDDVFRFTPVTGSPSLKYAYNQEANFWVFYIGAPVLGERERSIWVQAPRTNRAHRYFFGGLSKSGGLKLKPVPRDRSAYSRYIEPFENELNKLTSLYYEDFKSAFEEVEIRLHNTNGTLDVPSVNSDIEWPYYKLLYI